MTNYVSTDPLNNLTNTFQRPIFINAERAPNVTDIYPPGSKWQFNTEYSSYGGPIYQTSGGGVWDLSDTGNVARLTGNTGTAVPDSDQNINILGASGQIEVTGSGSTLTLSLAGGGQAIDSFIPDSGTSPVVPASNGSVTLSGTGSIQSVGGTNQLTYQLTGLTDHNVLVGAGTATITKVPPSATSGVPLISNGSSVDPSFGTAVVAGGGTGATSFTAYSVLCGGTTSTAPIQTVSGLGTDGQVLTSQGPGLLPIWGDGDIVQVVRLNFMTPTTLNGGFPPDNTIPQQGEGTEIYTLTITPTKATNILVIESLVTYCNDTNPASFVNCLFQDSTADALSTVFISNGANEFCQLFLKYSMVAGTTSATTFKIRGGNSGAAINYFLNSTSIGPLFGGTLTSYFQITEYPN